MTTATRPFDIEGAPADVMSVAGALVGGPVERGSQSTLPHWLTRLRSHWRHRIGRGERGLSWAAQSDYPFTRAHLVV